MIGIVYHEDYNKYDLGINHPLVGDKPKKTMDLLRSNGILENIKIFSPITASEEDLLRVHSEYYIQRIKELSKTGGMLSTDTPAPKGIYDIARLATGGTILAGTKLFEGFSIMVNPLAGFHHASQDRSSGFCFFNDIAVCIEFLKEKHGLKRFAIVDLDVHHGNGTQDIFEEDPAVLNISFHQDGKTLYPGTGEINFIGHGKGEGYTVNLPFPPGTGSEGYKYAFNQIIPSLLLQWNPEIIIYQSGVDTHQSDPLADLKLSFQTYYFLAKQMKKISEITCNKLIVLFGGGYNGKSSVIAYYNEMCGFLDKNDIIKEQDKTQFQKFEKVKELVSELKDILKPYWSL